jgi:NADP-dependent 3-hydroxy acid dehydrogenase YdfG
MLIMIFSLSMGLGFATARESARQGALVSMVDFNEKALNEAGGKIRSEFPDAQILTILADASNKKS